MAAADSTRARRLAMVRHMKDHYGLRDPRILAAMETVPRHRFIPESMQQAVDAYGDYPCPIGEGQTISQPYIVAYMIDRLAVQRGERVLEIGMGSGYEAAVLAEMGLAVFSIERIPPLAARARAALATLGYDAIQLRTGDGYAGWPEEAPFDIIMVSCAPEAVPAVLRSQLADGGRMMVPVGAGCQHLVIVTRTANEETETRDLSVRFVPMIHDVEC
jgi:protein-L-isoaspartate(D-aspartate) O-methyltransferase